MAVRRVNKDLTALSVVLPLPSPRVINSDVTSNASKIKRVSSAVVVHDEEEDEQDDSIVRSNDIASFIVRVVVVLLPSLLLLPTPEK
jgi:hypothetical protein